MTAEQTAIQRAPAFMTWPTFSAFMPPIATCRREVSFRAAVACFTYSRPTAGAVGFVGVAKTGPSAA